MPKAVSLGRGTAQAERGLEESQHAIINPRVQRLGIAPDGTESADYGGALTPGTVIAESVTKKVRIRSGGVGTLRAIGKFSAVTATPEMRMFGMAGDAVASDDTVGTRHTKGDPVATVITGAGIFMIERDSLGEEFVELDIVCAAGEGCTVDWIDVLGQ